MEKKRLFNFHGHPNNIVFVDRDDEEKFYCMDKPTVDEKNRILNQFGGMGHEQSVPDEYTIMVYPIQWDKSLNDTVDEYVPSKIPVPFPINRILWKMIPVQWE